MKKLFLLPLIFLSFESHSITTLPNWKKNSYSFSSKKKIALAGVSTGLLSGLLAKIIFEHIIPATPTEKSFINRSSISIAIIEGIIGTLATAASLRPQRKRNITIDLKQYKLFMNNFNKTIEAIYNCSDFNELLETLITIESNQRKFPSLPSFKKYYYNKNDLLAKNFVKLFDYLNQTNDDIAYYKNELKEILQDQNSSIIDLNPDIQICLDMYAQMKSQIDEALNIIKTHQKFEPIRRSRLPFKITHPGATDYYTTWPSYYPVWLITEGKIKSPFKLSLKSIIKDPWECQFYF